MTVTRNIEKKVVASIKSQQLSCGECVGFSREVVKDKKLCNQCGILPTSKPCKQFKPNTNELIELVEEGEAFHMLSALLRQIPENKLRLIGATIMRENQTRIAGYHMGQKVYVRYRGQARANFVSNFMSAVILYADHEMLRVTSTDGKCCMTFSGTAREAIYSVKEYKALREKMVKQGRYVDPDTQRLVAKRLRCEEEYELGIIESADPGETPTIDRVFKENKVAKKRPNDLVAIVNAIESGFEVKSKGKKKTSSSTKSNKARVYNDSENGVDVNN